MKPVHYARFAPGLVFLCAMSQAHSADNLRLAFDIHGKQLEEALTEFAQATKLQVLFKSEIVRAQKAPVVSGALTPEAALQQLLSDSGLRYEFINSKTISIRSQDDFPVANFRGTRDSLHTHAADGDTVGSGSAPVAGEERASDENSGIPQVLVNGSRSLNADIERTRDDVLPYVVLDRHTIERSGATSVDDLLRTHLTMNYVPQTSAQAVAVGLSSESQIALRGLSSRQTLVLIDGRRAPSRGVAGGEVQGDLNGIPLSAIERIEVLPATAAGIYGGDATGGVVNVVLRRNYSGINTSLTYGDSFDHGGGQRGVDMAGQTSFFNGSTSLGFRASYSNATSLLTKDRDFYREYSNTVLTRRLAENPAYLTNSAVLLGATTNIISNTVVQGVLQPLVLDDGTRLNSTITHVPYGYTGTMSDNGHAFVSSAASYNLDAPDNAQLGGRELSLLSEPTRRSFAVTARQKLTRNVDVFLELTAASSASTFNNSAALSTFTLAADAPANPFQQSIVVNTPIYGFPQTSSLHSKDYGALTGVIFQLPSEWRGEIDYSFQRDQYEQAVAASTFNSSAAGAVSSGTVDVFKDTTLFTTGLASYMVPGSTVSPTHSLQNNVTMRMAGPFGSLPGGPIVISSLAEYRKQEYALYSTISYSSTGTPTPLFYTPQSSEARSVYLEGRLPFISSVNARDWVQSLELQVAGRYDDYHQLGGGFAASSIGNLGQRNDLHSADPTVGLRFQPLQDVTFRGSFGTGFTTPSLNQLQPQPTQNRNSQRLSDPIRGNEPLGLVSVQVGGRDHLEPEDSRNWSAGVILTPRAAPAFRLSFDWTKITKTNNITAVLFNQAAINAEGTLPGLITRGPANGKTCTPACPIIGFDGRYLNATRGESESYDIGLDYEHATDNLGTFGLQLAGTRLSTNTLQLTAALPAEERAGTYYSPEWSANGSVSWRWRAFDIQWDTQYLDAYWINIDHSVVALQQSARIQPALYHNVTAGYRFQEQAGDAFTSAFSNLDIRVGVRNVFNKPPRFSADTSYTYDSWSSPEMAYYYVTVRKSF